MQWLWLALLLTACTRGPEVADDSSTTDTEDTDTEDTDTDDTDTEDTDTEDTDTDTSDTGSTVRDLCGPSCSTCIALPEPDGNTYCADPVDPYRESCAGGSEDGACCDDADCGADAQCTAFSYNYCGGAAPPDENVCHYSQCADSTECGTGEVCILAGGLGFAVNTCVLADCSADTDCSSKTGGECTLFNVGSCGGSRTFACTYDDDACRSDTDCTGTSGDRCRLTADRSGTECYTDFPPP